MKNCQADVAAFNVKFGVYSQARPAAPPLAVQELRARLIHEEVGETLDAMEQGDLAGVADGIVDSIYVLIGAALAYGIDLVPVWDAVQAANMAKVGGGQRADGKIQKPAGWVAPDIAGILAKQAA